MRSSTSSWRTSQPVYGKGLRPLSIATAVVLTGAIALVFFYAPMDADQGFMQKIFYVHVPMAIVSLCGMVLLYITLWRYELASKNVRAQVRALRRRLGGEVVVGRSAAPQ